MKNKTVKMVLAVVVLGVCCGAYAGVKTYVAHQEQKESEEDSEESTTVFTASTDNIKSLDFMVDDTETTFEKDDDSWVKKDETDFPVNQTTLDSAASAIASVDSDRVLDGRGLFTGETGNGAGCYSCQSPASALLSPPELHGFSEA